MSNFSKNRPKNHTSDKKVPESVSELTQNQKEDLMSYWDSAPTGKTRSLSQMIECAFPGQNIDGRSKQGRLVRAFLADDCNIRASTNSDYVAKPKIILDEAQRLFIENNHSKMKPLEMAKNLWGDQISNLGQENRAVIDHIQTLSTKEETYDPGEVEEYKPVRQMSHVLYRVNRYVSNIIDPNKMNPKVKKDMQCLLRFMTTQRFVSQINTYSNKRDWELFESTFVRGTYDKNDLTQEEIDQYIILSAEAVAEQMIRRNQAQIQDKFDEDLSNGQNPSGNLVDALSDFTRQLENNLKRQATLVKTLTGTRENRMKTLHAGNASVLNLVEIWKDEQGRLEILAMGEKYKDAVMEEVERLSGMDELKCKIIGISPEEVMNG